MISSPAFSVLLPTKNRASLVIHAIESVLSQTWTDFELIVCDNDASEDTKQVVAQFNDVRVQYIRTGGLSMLDNWNTALSHAKGENIILLEDKMMLSPNALERVNSEIAETASGVVVWNADVLNDVGNRIKIKYAQRSEPENRTPNEIVEKFLRNAMRVLHLLPRGLCTSLPRALIEQIESETGDPFYSPFSPDVVSAFKILSQVSDYRIVGEPLSLVFSTKVSTGGNAKRRTWGDWSYYSAEKPLLPEIPELGIRNEKLQVNWVLADFFIQKAKANGRLGDAKLTNKSYFNMLFREFISSSITKKKINWDLSEIRELMLYGDGLFANLVYCFEPVLELSFRSVASTTKNIRNGRKSWVSAEEASTIIRQYKTDGLSAG